MARIRRGGVGRYGARADLLSAGPSSGLLNDVGVLDVLPEEDREADYGHGLRHNLPRAPGPVEACGQGDDGDLATLSTLATSAAEGREEASHGARLTPAAVMDLPVSLRVLGEGAVPFAVVDLEQVPRRPRRWLLRGARKVLEVSAAGDRSGHEGARDAVGQLIGPAAGPSAPARTPAAPDQPADGAADRMLDGAAGWPGTFVTAVSGAPARGVPFAAPPSPRTGEDDLLEGGRRRRRGRDAEPGADVMNLPAPQGYLLRRSAGKARRGWYAPIATPALTSTRQAAILNPALVAAPTTAEGILIGRDRLSNTPVAHDPFTAYETGTITSPNVVVLGVIGAGKSSLLKTVYVLRPLIFRNRRAVVMDRKDRGGEGEYCETSRQLGAEPLRFVIGGGGTRLNLLDLTVLAGSGVAGQARLLIALAELANDGAPLDKWERAALRAAHMASLAQAGADGAVPLLEHLLHHLGRVVTIMDSRQVPLPQFTDYSLAARERFHQAGLGVRHLLSALLSDELAGLFDGPTSAEVRLAERLTVFDVSQLPDEGPAVSMVMAVANVWLMGTLRGRRGLRTNFIAEEGWDLVGGPGGRVFQRNSKLARGLGLSNIAALHHVADTPPDDPAVAMLKEAQTVHLYRQDREDDIDAVINLYGLDPGSRGTLPDLDDGHHLLKIGNHREIHVEHVRSHLERGLTNTDEAMVSAGRGRGLAGVR